MYMYKDSSKYQPSPDYLKALAKRLTEVLCDLVHSDAAHGPHCQSSDERVWVIAILGKGVDSQDG